MKISAVLLSVFMAVCAGNTFCLRSASAESGYAESFYGDFTSTKTITETISYSYKTVTDCKLPYGVPFYYNLNNDLTNACAPVAGATVVGYYDSIYDELIPDYTVGRTTSSTYVYYAMNSTIQTELIDPLYTRMETNTTGEGTTSIRARVGLRSFIIAQGRSCSYKKAVDKYYYVTADLAQTAVENGYPMLLFASEFTLVWDSTIQEGNGSDVFVKKYYYTMHAMVGYGYRQIDYYDSSDTLIDSVLLVYISTGILEAGLCFMVMDMYTWVDEGYMVVVN